MRDHSRYALLMGALCALVGLGVGLSVWSSRPEPGFVAASFIVSAPLAAFVTAWSLWRVLGRLQKSRSLWWGGWTGGMAGILAHWVCWYLEFISMNVCYWLTGGCVSSLGDPPADLLYALVGAAVLSFPSLILFGGLTIPLGAVLGGLVAGIQRWVEK